ncbi:MAG: hypothetical protein IKN04_10535 [Clostridia bacterium]|nr:hypothetical protein [Clostridia bacterium]
MNRTILKRVLTLVLILALAFSAWFCGYREGMRHVIYDAIPFIVELPEAGDDYFTVYIEIDDDVHEYEGFIG